MKNVTKKDVKVLLETCTDVGRAKEIIDEFCCFETVQEKVEFLKELYGIVVVEHEHSEYDENTYTMTLSAIVHAKWRG